MLKMLATALRKAWTEETYSQEFQARESMHKNFDHALKHVDKARSKLHMMCEEADHFDRPMTCFPREEAEKYLADLIISAVRAAETFPLGGVDLEKAVLLRLKAKMGIDL
jgi:hypothetical protein